VIVRRSRMPAIVFGGLTARWRGSGRGSGTVAESPGGSGPGGYGTAERPPKADPRWELFALDVLSAAPMVTRRFTASPAQVRPARAFVAELLGAGHPRLDDAILLTGELAGNAVRHTARGHEFSVSVLLGGEGVLVAVRDHGKERIPHRRAAAEDETGGRGLELVNALAARWGFHRDTAGETVVWFQPADQDANPRLR